MYHNYFIHIICKQQLFLQNQPTRNYQVLSKQDSLKSFSLDHQFSSILNMDQFNRNNECHPMMKLLWF